MRTWADLFTNRQLTALTTFSDLIRKARARIIADGADDGYADAVVTYLASSVSIELIDIIALVAWDSSPKMEPFATPSHGKQSRWSGISARGIHSQRWQRQLGDGCRVGRRRLSGLFPPQRLTECNTGRCRILEPIDGPARRYRSAIL